jgi:hypothetical protein
MAKMTENEAQQVEQANGSDRTPVVFVHGLWLLRAASVTGTDLVIGGGLVATL